MVEAFRLPHAPFAVQSFVDLVGGRSLDRVHDPCERADFLGLLIHGRGEDNMHMVWHYYDNRRSIFVPWSCRQESNTIERTRSGRINGGSCRKSGNELYCRVANAEAAGGRTL